MTDHTTPTPSDQPDGIDEQSTGRPDPIRSTTTPHEVTVDSDFDLLRLGLTRNVGDAE